MNAAVRRRRLACLSGALLLGLSSQANAADAALIAAAKKEGKVVWYTTLIVNQVVLPLKAAFEKKYPGVRLEYSRADEQPNAIKILNEARAGRVQADIYDGVTIMEALRRAGLVAPFTIPNDKDYPVSMKAKDSTWHALLQFVFTAGYNTKMVSKAEMPKTYQDLLNPKWKGKMAWHSDSIVGAYGFVGNILLSMGKTRGMKYLRALSKQKIIPVDASARAILDQVIAGEYPIGLMMLNNHAVISARAGAPCDWRPIAPVPVAFDSVGLVKGAPHPAAAKLLLDFLLSNQGQHVLAKADYLPALPSVPALAPGLRPQDGGFKATWLRPKEVDRNLKKWAAIANHLFK